MDAVIQKKRKIDKDLTSRIIGDAWKMPGLRLLRDREELPGLFSKKYSRKNLRGSGRILKEEKPHD